MIPQEKNITPQQPPHSMIDDPDLFEFERAIKNLRDLIETKVQLTKVFNSIHHKLNRGHPSEDILNSLFSSLDMVIPYDRMGIALLENDDQTLRLVWVKSKMSISHLEKDYVADIKESSLKKVIDSGRPRIINDLQAYLSAHPNSKSTKLALQDGIKSSFTCPLIVDGRPIGVIFFSSGKTETYKDIHKDLFCEISEGIALVVEQGLLKQALSESTSKEKQFRNTIHDLSNPLNVIQGTLFMIERKDWFKQLTEDSKKSYLILKRNCDSMVKLIHEIIYHKKNHISGGDIQKSLTYLDKFISELESDSEAMASKKNIAFSLSKDRDLPIQVKLDTIKIKIAIGNLVSNAVKYSQEGSHVFLNVEYDQQLNRLIFTVTDQGQGIKEKELVNLFKEHGTTSASPTAGEVSRGLGLANVKHMVELHGGKVFVRSKFGSGSSFGFWIPLDDAKV